MRLSIIVAVAENGVIGREGRLPWHLSDDLRRFRQLTMDRTIVMGRRTWESIGRPLPGRRMIVVSRRSDLQIPGVAVAGSIEEAIQIATADGDDELFFIGGAEIYRAALPRADRLYLTRVEAKVDGDTWFPAIDPAAWKLVDAQSHDADDMNDYRFTFEVYDRA